MRWTMRRTLSIVAAAGAAVAVLAVGVAPASADHTHFRVTGGGDCVLLAPDGGEKYVELPHADSFAPNRRHPLHVNVHLGQPGEVGEVWVAYNAAGVLDPKAVELCGGEFLND
jgi:hypothetical protein